MSITPKQFRQTAINKALRMLHLMWQKRINPKKINIITTKAEKTFYQKLVETKNFPWSFTNKDHIKYYEARIQVAAASALQKYADNNPGAAPALLTQRQDQWPTAFWTKPTEKRRMQEEKQLKERLKNFFISDFFYPDLTNQEATRKYFATLRGPSPKSDNFKPWR